MTRPEAADYIGVSPRTLANWHSSGRVKIPFYKVGRKKLSTSKLISMLTLRLFVSQPNTGTLRKVEPVNLNLDINMKMKNASTGRALLTPKKATAILTAITLPRSYQLFRARLAGVKLALQVLDHSIRRLALDVYLPVGLMLA